MTPRKSATKAPAKKAVAKKRSAPVRKQPPKSVTMVQVGTAVVPLVYDPNCFTCQSDHRFFLENRVLSGDGFAAVGRQSASMEGHNGIGIPTAASIRNHFVSGHPSQPQIVRGKIVHNRAEHLGMQIMGEDNLIDYVTLNELILNRGMERLLSEEIEPSMGDLLTAIRNQHSFESLSEKGFDVEAYEQTMYVYFSTAEQHMAPQQFEAMMASLKKNPILRALSQKSQSEGDE